jgi:hypothetical protein
VPSPTIAGTLKVQAPAFVRKLGRASRWELLGNSLQERAKAAVKLIFRNQPGSEISIYLVATDDDLRRVAIGMNANRDSLTETIEFLPFNETDLTAAGIGKPIQTPGDLKCEHANALHFDMTASDDQLEKLCVDLRKAKRDAARCTKGAMKDAEKLTVAEKCKSAPNVHKCGVRTCAGGDP